MKVKIVKKIGLSLWSMLMGYGRFVVTTIMIFILSYVIAWVMDINIGLSFLSTAFVWVTVEVREARGDCAKAVTRVEALKETLVNTYSTTRSIQVGDKEFEAVAVQAQVFHEKSKKGKSE
jgi:hypothetical protein